MAEGEPFVIRRIGVAVRADVLAVGAAAVEIQAVVADVGEYAVITRMPSASASLHRRASACSSPNIGSTLR